MQSNMNEAQVSHLAHAPFLRGLGSNNVLGIPSIQMKRTVALNLKVRMRHRNGLLLFE